MLFGHFSDRNKPRSLPPPSRCVSAVDAKFSIPAKISKTTPKALRHHPATVCGSVSVSSTRMKVVISLYPRQPLREISGHEVLHGRANINCVTWITHTICLLRSILFRALPSHATYDCLRRASNIKLGRKFGCGGEKHNGAVTPSQRKFPPGFAGLGRCCLLTQFNLPVVMSMVRQPLFKTSVWRPRFTSLLPRITAILFFES